MMARLRVISEDFTAPKDADQKWIDLYAKLKHLNDDMQTHLHLEDDILFRRAVALENQLGVS